MKKELRCAKINDKLHMLSKKVSLLFFSAFVLLVFTTYKNITYVKLIAFLALSIPFSLYYIFEKGSLALEGYISNGTNHLSKWLYSLLGSYALINVLSAVFSPYRNYVNGKGQSVVLFGYSRYDGLLLLLLCIMVFLVFSIEGGFCKTHTNTIAGTTLIVVVIGIMQMLGVQLFYPYGDFYSFKGVFVSTIGNIGVMSTYLIIAFAVVAFSYIAFNTTKTIGWFWLVTIVLTMAFLIEINVDTGRLAVVLLLCVALPIMSLNKEYFVKLLLVISATGIGCAISSLLVFSEKYGVQFKLTRIFFVCILLSLISLVACFFVNRYMPENKLKFLFVTIIVLETVVFIAILIYLKFGSNFSNKTLIEINNILNGKINDNYGSNRIGLWKYTLFLSFSRLPIGFGTGSFGIGFAEYLKEISIKLSNNTYDFAHNEYLQVLYNCGIFGLFSYLGLVVIPIVNGIKKLHTNPKAIVLTFAIIGYSIQAFFTFSIVIISPLFWLLLGMLWNEVKN